ncbi:MAG: hypothetical protein Q8M65_01120 [Rhodoglobus sp.]|nr:hypothetical protein [Rhodoglobus sp.]
MPAALATLLGKTDSPPWTEYGCPPLGEFYELVLQAHDTGVILAVDVTPDPTLARAWPFSFHVGPSEALGTLAVLAGTVALLLAGRWELPATAAQRVFGWLAGCALLSLGSVLAASAIVAGGGEARGLGPAWRTVFPHLRIDTGEALLGVRPANAPWPPSASPRSSSVPPRSRGSNPDTSPLSSAFSLTSVVDEHSLTERRMTEQKLGLQQSRVDRQAH